MGNRVFFNKRVAHSDIFFCFLSNSFFLKHSYAWMVKGLSGRVFLNILCNNVFILKFFNEGLKFWELF